jgi:plastocyanin
LIVCFALGGCNNTTTPLDTGNTSRDAGNDAAVISQTDAGIDAAPVDAGSTVDGGSTDCPETYANCTTIEEPTNPVVITAEHPTPETYQYTPRCIRVPVGTMVTIVNTTVHPLRAAACSPSDTPIPGGASTSTEFVFDHTGHYGFFCANHGVDDPTSTTPGMSGLIIVE